MPSLLSDKLLRDVMAAGQTDVLVGLPTQNHADTAGAVEASDMLDEPEPGSTGRDHSVDAGADDTNAAVSRSR